MTWHGINYRQSFLFLDAVIRHYSGGEYAKVNVNISPAIDNITNHF